MNSPEVRPLTRLHGSIIRIEVINLVEDGIDRLKNTICSEDTIEKANPEMAGHLVSIILCSYTTDYPN
jgi:hypothetical protein